MKVIEVDGLSRSFSYYKKEAGLRHSLRNLVHREKLVKEAVRGISFAIEEGEMTGFLGPNGAGKTTTLKMLAGILFPTAGQASVLGFTPWERRKDFKKQIAIVMGQKSQLWWDLPAVESFALNRAIYELDERAYRSSLDELTELLEVRELLGVQVRRLSLGERMKMELIAALLHRPRVMFLDEPTIGLDILSQRRIREFLKYYNTQNHTTVLLTSHYMNDIEDLCRRCVLINEGRIVYDGELARVGDVFSGKKRIKVQLEHTVERADLERLGQVKEYDGANAVLEADRSDIKAVCAALLSSLPVVDFNIEDIPLEEGIAVLYRKEVAP